MDYTGYSGNRFRRPPRSYFQVYKAFPASFFGKEEVEKGNMSKFESVLLPASAAEHLMQLHISYPMLFSLTNTHLRLKTHCGVLEFTAEEGTCILPFWVKHNQMMNHLAIPEGGNVTIENISLPKGSFVKIQPHETAFINLPNPKAVLENSLRKYACLTQGDSIVIDFAGRKYEIDIVETRPTEAIMTIETDIEVDFMAPRDYEESPIENNEGQLTFPGSEPDAFGEWGRGETLDGRKGSDLEKKEETKQSEYDPRRHRIRNGVRQNENNTVKSYWDSLGGGRSLK